VSPAVVGLPRVIRYPIFTRRYYREVSYSYSLSYRHQHIDTDNDLLFFRFSNLIAKQRLSDSDDRRCD
jgi:hypothetical protein